MKFSELKEKVKKLRDKGFTDEDILNYIIKDEEAVQSFYYEVINRIGRELYKKDSKQ